MKNMRCIALVGLVLVAGVTAQAADIPFEHAWPPPQTTQAPILAHVSDYDSDTFYTGFFVNGVQAPRNVALLPGGGIATDGNIYPALAKVAGNGSMPGEDSWGVFSIDTFYEGAVPDPTLHHNNITSQNHNKPLFHTGDSGLELAGIFHGRTDVAVTFFPDGSSKAESIGDYVEIYLQPLGTFDHGDAGSSGRVTAGKYATVGFDADGNPLPGSTLVLQGVDQAGFLGSAFVPGAEEVSHDCPVRSGSWASRPVS